ncbi:Thioredoxin domain [Ignisphaera aggregans DSM 17230]|uniref:Thioredoxin domain n=1 Tax=Ignisphaera aggregans (strain DSM 17230 / JCM 13409 / AQ1.S1) TaxID=583356 RepID=E0SQJ9_IGNAA|nr:Thioredoxin domain [Ignisphaera aggregans DSM 17230]
MSPIKEDPINEIDELDSILNTMAQNIIRTSYSRDKTFSNIQTKCCNTVIEGGISIRSYSEFIQLINSCRVAFVLITTTYCPYCQLFKPVFFRVAREFAGKAVFIEANADYVPEVAETFNVYSTPTTVIIIDKRPIDAILGYIPYNHFKRYVNDIVSYAECGEI